MIFYNRKNAGKDFSEVVATTLENLQYLNNRICSISEKIPSPIYQEGSVRLSAMKNQIEEVNSSLTTKQNLSL